LEQPVSTSETAHSAANNRRYMRIMTPEMAAPAWGAVGDEPLTGGF
jgi:hypothetical protein